MKTRFLAFGLLLTGVALTVSGCATTSDYVTLNYSVQGNATRIQGADSIQVKVVVDDQRAVKDRVSAKKDMSGNEIGPIMSVNDVRAAFQQALEHELRNRGFKVGTEGTTVEFTLIKFYNDFVPRVFLKRANTDTASKVRVINRNGEEVLVKNMGEDWSKPVMRMSAGRAQAALNKALTENIRNLFRDSDFVNALMK